MSRKTKKILTKEQMFTIINSTTIKLEVLIIGRKKENELNFVFPSEEEIKAAQLICCGKYCSGCESPAAYAWRKRQVDLSVLLEKAIRNELSGTEHEVVVEHWYNSLNLTQVAEKRSTSVSAVKRALDRATEKLEKVLGYVVCYQNDVCKESVIPLALGRARAIAAARNASGGDSGERLMHLRQSQCVSKKDLSKVTGIKELRIDAIEHGAVLMSDELIKLSGFYDISTDFILKGEGND